MRIILVLVSLFFCSSGKAQIEISISSPEDKKQEISAFLDSWHNAAAEADFKDYFGKMTDDAIYIGTDASENWSLEEFKAFAKPYFARGTAWDFDAVERNIYLSDSGKMSWFDELLESHMGLIRGSGVLVKENGKWKIRHYVLSFTVPNDLAGKVTNLISEN